MTIIILLVVFSMVVAGGFLGAFLWAVRSGQYEDTYSPAVRILFEDQVRDKKDEKPRR
jgi:cbb3-type cytochrome oxidase maturation protein